MRFINKTTVFLAGLGLLLLYIIRKRKTADERPTSNDDAPTYANLAVDASDVSVTAAAPPPVDVTADAAPPADSAHDTQADTDVAEHPDLSLYEDAFGREDAAIDEPMPAADTQDTNADTEVVAQPDLSLGDDTVEQEDTAIDEPPIASDTQDTNADTDVVAQPDISLGDEAVEQADDALDEPTPASEVAPKPKSPSSPQRRRSAQPSPNRQRQPTARTQPKRQSRPRTRTQPARQSKPRRHMGRRVRTGAYYLPLSPPTEKASLRCRETGEGWEIYIALPQERAVVKVTHGGDDLDYLQASSETELPLSRFAGDVVIHYQDDTADRITLLNAADGAPLLFKMQRNWEGEGRLVGNPTAGHVLAIAPLDYADEWNVDEPHVPEDCVDENFEARFLFLEGVAPDGTAPMLIEGDALYDDSDIGHHGKLYIGAPPKLWVDPQITDARIVEETGVRELNKWGENFDPHRQSIASVLSGRNGRFSIRTYHDGQRQESKPFRYFPALRRITLNGEPHSPDNALLPDKRTGKHREIALRFKIDDGDALRPERVSHDEVRVADDGVVIIPMSPSIQTLICNFPNRATIAVDVPRVWWRLTDEDGATGEWGGETHEFYRSEFMNLMNSRIEISVPSVVDVVEVGFGNYMSHKVRVRQGSVEFRLMGFANHREVEYVVGKDLLLNIRVNGQTAPIARVLADVEEGSVVSGEVVHIERGRHMYMLEITGKSGQSFDGFLPVKEMTTMTETERAEITKGQRLRVYVTEVHKHGRRWARLSVDKLTDANHNADEE